jgi:hypothetical protein
VKRWRLLPAEVGWRPYAWLVYGATFLVSPFIRWRNGQLGATEGLVTLLATAIFLAAGRSCPSSRCRSCWGSC